MIDVSASILVPSVLGAVNQISVGPGVWLIIGQYSFAFDPVNTSNVGTINGYISDSLSVNYGAFTMTSDNVTGSYPAGSIYAGQIQAVVSASTTATYYFNMIGTTTDILPTVTTYLIAAKLT